MSDATQFGLSENFPTNLTRLTSALLLGKLALCEKLEGVIETRIVASLMLHLNSTDFRLPVQMMPLSRLAKLSQISKSTLCDKLHNLRMMGILKNSERERQIAFTDEAISLFHGISEKIQKSEKSEKIHKKENFGKFGKFWLPRTAAMFLIGRGLKEEAVAGLMRKCKEHKHKLQNVITEFKSVLVRYAGDVLYRVACSIILNPARFKPQAVTEKAADLEPAQRLALHRIANGQLPLLASGESMRHTENGMTISSPKVRGGAPMLVTSGVWNALTTRARRACEAALPAGRLESTLDIGLYTDERHKLWMWNGEVKDERPLIHMYGRTVLSEWVCVFEALTPEQQALAIEDVQRDPRLGRWLEHGGVRYQVEGIDGDRVTLYALEGNGKRYVQYIKLAQLGSAKVVWL